MPFTTIVSGTTITASWGNANVRDQVATPFTDTTARNSAISAPVAGMISALTTTGRLDIYNGSSWSAIIAPAFGAGTSWTPVLTGTTTNPTLGTGSSQTGTWFRMGRLVVAFGRVLFGTSGAAAGSGNLNLSLPVNSTAANAFFGWSNVVRAAVSGNDWLNPASATQMQFVDSGGGLVLATTFTNNDSVRFCVIYEAAADG